ncbi:MAG: ribosomal protein S18-alanine N-acetyltransferase [Fusobacteriaceae bacterium]
MIYQVKEYTEKILEEIYSLEREIFDKNAYKKEQIKNMIENSQYKIFVFKELNKEIDSYLIVYNSFDVYEIIKIGVKKEKRNLGYGKLLLDNMKKEYNLDLLLEVRESNTVAIKFYEKNNFEKISVRKNYYSDNNENAIIMKLTKISEEKE